MSNNIGYPEDKPLSVGKIAKVLGVSNKTVLNLIYKNEMIFFRTIGGHYRVMPHDLSKFINKRGWRVKFVVKPTLSSTINTLNSELVIIYDVIETGGGADKVISVLQELFPNLKIKRCASAMEAVFYTGYFKPQWLIWGVNGTGDYNQNNKILSILQLCRVGYNTKILVLKFRTILDIMSSKDKRQKLFDDIIWRDGNKDEIKQLISDSFSNNN